MNDTQLDEILNTWTAPQPPPSLRETVRAGFAASQERKTFPNVRVHWKTALASMARKCLLAAAILGVLGFLLIATQASPTIPVPYTVDSEFLRYAEDGSSKIEMFSTSYELNGAEILRSRSIPDRPFGTAIGRALDATLPLWSRLMARFTVDAGKLERLRRAARQSVGAITGCDASCLVLEHHFLARAAASSDTACIGGAIVGSETILNYPTVGVQLRWGRNGRTTWWTAPDLGCFALRITTEEKQPDGTYRLVSEKRALRVNMNP